MHIILFMQKDTWPLNHFLLILMRNRNQHIIEFYRSLKYLFVVSLVDIKTFFSYEIIVLRHACFYESQKSRGT